MTDPSLNLPAIIAGHMKWLRDEPGGSRANLYGADLSRAISSAWWDALATNPSLLEKLP